MHGLTPFIKTVTCDTIVEVSRVGRTGGIPSGCILEVENGGDGPGPENQAGGF